MKSGGGHVSTSRERHTHSIGDDSPPPTEERRQQMTRFLCFILETDRQRHTERERHTERKRHTEKAKETEKAVEKDREPCGGNR